MKMPKPVPKQAPDSEASQTTSRPRELIPGIRMRPIRRPPAFKKPVHNAELDLFDSELQKVTASSGLRKVDPPLIEMSPKFCFRQKLR
jgi:hypothetical protein